MNHNITPVRCLDHLLIDAIEARPHESPILFKCQQLQLLYHKTHFAQGYAVNPSCYAPGTEFPVARTRLGAIGVMICFDHQLPEVARC